MASQLPHGRSGHVNAALLIQPMLFVSLVLVGVGIGLGVWIYRKAGAEDGDRPAETDPVERAQPALFRFLEHKMWIDEIYRPDCGRLELRFARRILGLDGSLHLGWTCSRVRIVRPDFPPALRPVLDERGINAGIDETTAGARGLGRLFAAAHSGQIQNYLAAVAIGCSRVLLLYAWLA